MSERTKFPPVFWVANTIEVLEHFSYYGIYFGFGIYMGSNFLAVGLGGATSGVTYTSLYGYFGSLGHPEYVWYTLAVHYLLGIAVLYLFIRLIGEFAEREE